MKILSTHHDLLNKHPTIDINMDVSEPFRATDDLTKQDFFDFITTAPDAQTNYQTFAKQMRNVNVFFEDDTINNNVIVDHLKHETNNNNIMLDPQTIASDGVVVTGAGDPSVGTFDTTTHYWNNNDKETVKLETAILDDLNKYCNWNQSDAIATGGDNGPSAKCGGGGAVSNTDGHIYTLTILNGVDQTNWYRAQLNDNSSRDDDGSNLNIEQISQHGLDIDSILNIMPTSFSNSYDSLGATTTATEHLSTDGLIKSETYTYDENNFDTKEDLSNSLIIGTPMLDPIDINDTYNNNNNDWKVDNNNSSDADSLLRSALQGKSILRYNGQIKKPHITQTIPRDERLQHTELQKVLASSSSSPVGSVKESDGLISVLANSNSNVLLFNDACVASNSNQSSNNEVQLSLSENHQSQSTMEEILLSQLESAAYPEDFEKIKQIATEVAESVYYQLEPVDGNIYISGASDTNSIVIQPQQQQTRQIQGVVVQSTTSSNIATSTSVLNQQQQQKNVTNVVTSTKPTKKYKRNTSQATKHQHQQQQQHAASTSSQLNVTTIQTATSTSNGIRKERSLHYCGMCSKGFKDKYSVNVHIRTHTGEKPFACSLCGKSFRQKAHLAKHYQTHIAQKNAAAANSAAGNSGKKGAGTSIASTSHNSGLVSSPISNQCTINNSTSVVGTLTKSDGPFKARNPTKTHVKTEPVSYKSSYNEQFTTAATLSCDSTLSSSRVMSTSPEDTKCHNTRMALDENTSEFVGMDGMDGMDFDDTSVSDASVGLMTTTTSSDKKYFTDGGKSGLDFRHENIVIEVPNTTKYYHAGGNGKSTIDKSSDNIGIEFPNTSEIVGSFPVDVIKCESTKSGSVHIISNNVISSSTANLRTSPPSSTTS